MRLESAALGTSLADVDIGNVKELGENFEKMQSAIGGVFNLLAAGLAPILNKAFDGALEWMKKDNNMLQVVLNTLNVLATPIDMLLVGVDALSAGWKFGKAAILSFASSAASVLEFLTTPIRSSAENWDSLINVIVDGINYAIKGLNRLRGMRGVDIPLIDYQSKLGAKIQGVQQKLKDFAETSAKDSTLAFAESAKAWTDGYSNAFEILVGNATSNIVNAFANANKAAKDGIDNLNNTINSAKIGEKSIFTQIDQSKILPLGYQPNIKSGDSAFTQIGDMSKTTGVGMTTTVQQFVKLQSISEAEGKRRQQEYNDAVNFAKVQGASNLELIKQYETKVYWINEAAKSYDEEGNVIIDLATKQKALTEAAYESFQALHPFASGELSRFGDNIASGFTDMIMGAKSFAEVMHDVARQVVADIINMIIKQYILRTLFNSFGGMFGFSAPVDTGGLGDAMYGGGRASGGSVSAGTAYTVGEVGPELFIPQTNGVIIPHGMGTSDSKALSIQQNFNFATGVTRQELSALIPTIIQSSKSAVADAYKRGGAFRSALS
jgi:hypothetical protein